MKLNTFFLKGFFGVKFSVFLNESTLSRGPFVVLLEGYFFHS